MVEKKDWGRRRNDEQRRGSNFGREVRTCQQNLIVTTPKKILQTENLPVKGSPRTRHNALWVCAQSHRAVDILLNRIREARHALCSFVCNSM